MAKFFCKNCGATFFYDAKHDPLTLPKVLCPVCKSDWTECVGPGLEKKES